MRKTKASKSTVARALAVMDDAVAVAEREMAALRKEGPDPQVTQRALALGLSMGTMVGHIRRHEEAQAAAGRGLTKVGVIAYLRGLAEAERADVVREVQGDERRDEGSLLR